MSESRGETIVYEQERTYYWVSGPAHEQVTYPLVVSVSVTASGNHYLRLASGDLIIVKSTWDYIEIVPETPEKGWTF